jgi:hypothetical protein
MLRTSPHAIPFVENASFVSTDMTQNMNMELSNGFLVGSWQVDCHNRRFSSFDDARTLFFRLFQRNSDKSPLHAG